MAASADGNIVTDATATYAGLPVLGTKTDDTVRTDAENATYCGAEWATEVDAALKKINEIFRGTAGSYVWVTASSTFVNTGTTKVYIPLHGSETETAGTGNEEIQWVAPCAGQVVRVSGTFSVSTPGSTVISVDRGTDGNDPDTELESDTQNVAASQTAYHWDFTTAAAFSKGHKLSFGINPTGAMGRQSFVILIKLDTDTL